MYLVVLVICKLHFYYEREHKNTNYNELIQIYIEEFIFLDSGTYILRLTNLYS